MTTPSTEARDAAFQAFAEREMPWLLDKPEDDAERLMRTTALIAFGRGYQAGQLSKATPEAEDLGEAIEARRSCRSAMEPRLVHLICGLRQHQVKDAVASLLDYIDASADLAALMGAHKAKQQL